MLKSKAITPDPPLNFNNHGRWWGGVTKSRLGDLKLIYSMLAATILESRLGNSGHLNRSNRIIVAIILLSLSDWQVLLDYPHAPIKIYTVHFYPARSFEKPNQVPFATPACSVCLLALT